MKNRKLLIALYDGCQYHCTFCMYEHVKETQPLSKKDSMSKKDWYRLLLAAYARGFRFLDIAGRGEPTIHPAFTKVVAMAHELGFTIDLLTNGLNDKAIIEVLPFIRKLRINLNSIEEGEMHKIHKPASGFSFDRCITSVKNVVRAIAEKNSHIKPRTNYVMTTQSLEGAFTFPEKVNRFLAAELGAEKLYITYQHFYSYVKTAEQHLGFDDEGMQKVLSMAIAHRDQEFLLENTNLLDFIKQTELLIERLKPLSEKSGEDHKHSSGHTHYTCEAHEEILFVDGNGDCYGCYAPFRAVNGFPIDQDPFFFGNVRLQSLEEIFSKGNGLNPVMDVSNMYWRACLFCVAKGPVTASNGTVQRDK